MSAADTVDGREGAAAKVKEGAVLIGQGVRELGVQAKDMAKEKYGEARERAKGYYQQGKEKLGTYEETVEEYVRERPVKAILIAAGIGVLLGVLLGRRR